MLLEIAVDSFTLQHMHGILTAVETKFCFWRIAPAGPASITYTGSVRFETCTFRDQLGLVLSPKSKIEDGSREGTWWTLATAVGDS